MRNVITAAIVAATLGFAGAASAQSALPFRSHHLQSGRSAAASVQFDGYSANFGAGGRVYPGSQTLTGGPSGDPTANGG